MKISIITPTYNSSSTIAQNINSVINQTYKEYEHVIIDNLSSDSTLQLIKNAYDDSGLSDKLKVISEKDSGISDAFNKGIQHSDSELIGILNSDDYFYDESVLEKVLKEFVDEKVLFVHGNIFFYDNVFGSNVRKPLFCPITEAMPYNHPTMFFRKYVYEKYGGFDTSYKYAMDFEFVCRLEKTVPGFRDKGVYIGGDPLVVMNAGGASWSNEIKSIEESRTSLKNYSFWNSAARKNYWLRISRTYIKKYFSLLNLNGVIKYWRSKKWKN